ncbi:acyl-CoA reductase [Alteromonas ponticola]|uniref:Acyl-CoA reductase n=1 Tax=Alteromonas ponticola TaxID=2720613 RepID=A0ABX1R0Q0_9ALTE|nr:acyl-CoA reductase [Alteromonas ponticola]NMH59649.1 hypothetical protein [Alteromonas ponticola]
MDKSLVTQVTNVQDLSTLNLFKSENFRPYDKLVVAFISELSDRLLKNTDQNFSELVALGFWLRERSLEKEFKPYFSSLRKPVGLVVHYTPANVDTMFVYSWITSLICGNKNIVKLSSLLSDLQRTLLENIQYVLSKSDFSPISNTNLFVQFDKSNNAAADTVSMSADARILWGGDESVSAIRQLPIKPRCRDISFSDRYSASVLNGNSLTELNLDDVAGRFYRDIHPFEQQACSSPKILFWQGDATLQSAFFKSLGDKFNDKYSITLKNEQFIMAQSMAVIGNIEDAQIYNKLLVLKMSACSPLDLTFHNGQFSIWVVPIEEIKDLTKYCDEKMQTLSYWGIDKGDLVKFLTGPSIKGIDRLIPLGQALSFSSNWDGYSLVDQLTRVISVE